MSDESSRARQSEQSREEQREQHRRELQRAKHVGDMTRARLAVLGRCASPKRLGQLGMLCLLLTLVGGSAPIAESPHAAGSQSEPLDELWVKGALHIVDDTGRQVAVVGSEPGNEPVILGLYPRGANGKPGQSLRLAASRYGSAITIRSPAGDSAIRVLANERGPEILLERDGQRRVLSEQPELAGTMLPATASAGSPTVDLTVPDLQDVGKGFLLAQVNTMASGNDLRVTGRVINTTSVTHRDLEFRVGVGGTSETFYLPLVSPGNSTHFSVNLPGVAAADAKRAQVEYLYSTIHYYRHSIAGVEGHLSAQR